MATTSTTTTTTSTNPRRTVLITGSSSGFGLALTRHFLSGPSNWNVIATSRNPQRTPDLVAEVEASGRGAWLQLDVCDPQSKIDEVIAQAGGLFHGAGIDVVFNNAGYSVLGVVETIDEEAARKQMDANFWGTLKVCKAVIPGLRERGRGGWIVNFSSIAGLMAGMTCGVYAGSKFAVEGLTESLAQEIAPFNISTLLVEPGMFQTNFFNESNAMNLAPLPAHYRGTAAEEQHTKFANAGKATLRGDVDKAAARVREVVEGKLVLEGSSGEGSVKRLILGPDAFGRAVNTLGGKLEEVRRQEEISGSTDRDDFDG
ncbi:putative oxido [Cyphellophora attinorum]|uniref:Putative oxido n=1 Tax=Cyphellophora attinorum TaxID=1664694 RepID=A0A0N1P0V8_9EURO|nr:putative oxido [Phialophora attinorum]KPI44140.1 putative oxido [Phialophora attinorum]